MSIDENKSAKDTTHFGFQDVPTGEKEGMVKGVFESVSKRYDIMNDAMSGGLHRLWKASMIDQIAPTASMTHLDVAGGTGDIAFRFLAAARKRSKNGATPKITVCDINEAMLEVGRDRAIDQGILGEIDWVCGSAEDLPVEDKSIDIYTIAFGIRNVTHIDKALKEAFRVLKPGGRFYCLEFSKVALPGLDKIYDWYSFNMIPEMGDLITDDRDSYQYLVESIRKFPDQARFVAMIQEAGFSAVKYRNMSGGIVALHSGVRA